MSCHKPSGGSDIAGANRHRDTGYFQHEQENVTDEKYFGYFKH